jgi:hypothetical protein
MTQIAPEAEKINESPLHGAKKRQPIQSAAVSHCRLFLFPLNAADILLCLEAGCHDFMTTTEALQAKVRTGTQNFPPFFSTRVRFFHYQNVV